MCQGRGACICGRVKRNVTARNMYAVHTLYKQRVWTPLQHFSVALHASISISNQSLYLSTTQAQDTAKIDKQVESNSLCRKPHLQKASGTPASFPPAFGRLQWQTFRINGLAKRTKAWIRILAQLSSVASLDKKGHNQGNKGARLELKGKSQKHASMESVEPQLSQRRACGLLLACNFVAGNS